MSKATRPFIVDFAFVPDGACRAVSDHLAPNDIFWSQDSELIFDVFVSGKVIYAFKLYS